MIPSRSCIALAVAVWVGPTAHAQVERVDIGPVYSPGSYAVYDGALYFQASDSNTADGDIELYRYTSVGGATKIDVNPAGTSVPIDLVVFGGALYFVATGEGGDRGSSGTR